MILRSKNGNREIRDVWGTDHFIPSPGSGWFSAAGLAVSTEAAYGIPAVSNVIRSPAEIIASLPYLVYEKGETRERAETTWQWRLLHDQPSEECDTYQFFYDVALSLESTQNAFIQKAKFNGRVYELYALDPQTVTVERDKKSGEKRYKVWINGQQKDVPADQILHVRGFTPRPGGVAGVSLLQMHRDPIGAALAMQKFEGDYFRNNAVPPFWFTGASNREHAKNLVDSHNQAHAGSGNQRKAGAVWGNIDVKSIPVSMADADYAEQKRLSVEDACRIWRWPKTLLELTGDQGPVDENAWTARFLKFYLLPRLRRIERAFAADPDLFPTSGTGSGKRAGSRLYGEFLTAALERADVVTRYRAYKDARQGSWVTANELREFENLPPKEGGDELQVTPVGGAPNPPSPPGEGDEPSEEE